MFITLKLLTTHAGIVKLQALNPFFKFSARSRARPLLFFQIVRTARARTVAGSRSSASLVSTRRVDGEPPKIPQHTLYAFMYVVVEWQDLKLSGTTPSNADTSTHIARRKFIYLSTTSAPIFFLTRQLSILRASRNERFSCKHVNFILFLSHTSNYRPQRFINVQRSIVMQISRL